MSDVAETSSTHVAYSGLCAIALALVHLFASKLRFISITPRSRWLSGASGVSVAYVFVHLIPELGEMQESFTGPEFGLLEKHVYIMALIGMTAFYGLERLVAISKLEQADQTEEFDVGIYWLHVVSFAIYNALIGYSLFHREESTLAGLFLYTLVIGLHFVVNDFGLSQDYPKAYRHNGRWLVATAVIVGSVVGWGSEISEAGISLLFSFLAGSIILNVLKEELPEERKSKFSAFALGAFVYTGLLLLV
ncbi:MAG: hypothetical protein WBA10_15740 [Elainellaceae cyanobacterium]